MTTGRTWAPAWSGFCLWGAKPSSPPSLAVLSASPGPTQGTNPALPWCLLRSGGGKDVKGFRWTVSSKPQRYHFCTVCGLSLQSPQNSPLNYSDSHAAQQSASGHTMLKQKYGFTYTRHGSKTMNTSTCCFLVKTHSSPN